MNARTRETNIAIFTRACWLAGFSLDGVIRSCRQAGATDAEIAKVVGIYAAEDFALSHSVIVDHGAYLDRRAAS